jgi:hypothetical protein
MGEVLLLLLPAVAHSPLCFVLLFLPWQAEVRVWLDSFSTSAVAAAAGREAKELREEAAREAHCQQLVSRAIYWENTHCLIVQAMGPEYLEVTTE